MPEESRRGPIPREAVEFLERKGVQPGFSYLDVWAEEHHRAFTAAKVMREDVLEAMHQEVAKALREGKPYHEFSRDLGQRLQQMGWWGEQRVTDPMTGEVADVDVPSRLHRIYDTNMRTARAAGQWERIQRTKDTHPYLLYQLGPSKEHRPEHVAWHGLLLHVDDPFWREHFPPNGWGCKCWVRQVSRREAARLEKSGITAPEPKPVLDAAGLPTGHVDQSRKVPVRTERPATVYVDFKNKRTGVEERVPKGIDPGFHRPPTALTEPGGRPPGVPPSVPARVPQPPPPVAPETRRAAPASKPPLRSKVTIFPDGEPRQVRLSHEQQIRDRDARWLESSPEARETATFEERRNWMLWEWTSGAKRRTSLMLKQAAKAALGLSGSIYAAGKRINLPEPDVDRAKLDVQRMYNSAQEALRARGVATLRLYRGIKSGYAARGAIESWTADVEVAREFAGPNGLVQVEDVPAERILAGHDLPGWSDGPYGPQSEYLALW